ncbi:MULTISPECIES: cell division ATPase MinD [Haloferax]|uniref:AAA family ATPase n=1 Tax=Haloferax marinum TaxID=2666143 RepID=A0A6A8G5M3_9EURY|nr:MULTISPECIES: cell division ATPase MinD [Haloferax]KAB1197419.1 AAA family ATPase [Haloferax sp. CBA1150]MRW96464.1 AAA family ATPase [Haloferax marinum]
MSRVYAVASAKGGVGKTTTTANLGTVLSMAGHDVVVVDGDLGMPNLAGALGVAPDGETLHDVLTGETTVESATYDGPSGLSVLPGSTALEAFASANAKELHPVIETLKETHDIVLVDTGAGLSDDTFVPLKLADEVLLVSTTEREALGDTEKTRQLGERIGADVVGVVLTRVNQSNPNADEVASLLDAGVIAVVPEDAAIREALSTQTPVVARSPESIAAAGYRALAEALTGEPVPVPESETDDADEAEESNETEGPNEAEESDEAEDVTEQASAPSATVDSDDDVTVVQTDEESAPSAESDEDTSPEPDSEPEPETKPESESDLEPDSEPNPEADSEPNSESNSAPDQTAAPEPPSDEPVAAPPAEDESSDAESASEHSPEVEQSSTHGAAETEPEQSADVDENTPSDSSVEATLEAEAEATLEAETVDTPDEETVDTLEAEDESLDGAIPFGGGADSDGDASRDGTDQLADGVEDPVTANLDDAESMGPDPLAGDAVVDAPSGEAAESKGAPETDTDDEEATTSSEASAVVEEAPADAADEPLVAEAEPDAVAEDEGEPAGDGEDEEGVYTTSLVEEVESLEDDDEDDQKKGFLSRFLG